MLRAPNLTRERIVFLPVLVMMAALGAIHPG